MVHVDIVYTDELRELVQANPAFRPRHVRSNVGIYEAEPGPTSWLLGADFIERLTIARLDSVALLPRVPKSLKALAVEESLTVCCTERGKLETLKKSMARVKDVDANLCLPNHVSELSADELEVLAEEVEFWVSFSGVREGSRRKDLELAKIWEELADLIEQRAMEQDGDESDDSSAMLSCLRKRISVRWVRSCEVIGQVTFRSRNIDSGAGKRPRIPSPMDPSEGLESESFIALDDGDASEDDALPGSGQPGRTPSPGDGGGLSGDALRRALDARGYYQDYGGDSAALIAALFADLERARAAGGERGDDGADGVGNAGADSLADDLRAETARLTVENNRLHDELLREMDARDADAAAHRRALRELEDELAGLRRADGGGRAADIERERDEAERRAQAAEDRAFDLAERLDRALRSAETVFADERPARRPRADLSMLSELSIGGAGGAPDGKALEERVRLLEAEIADLDAEAEQLRAQNARLADEAARLREELGHSDAERRRAQQMLADRASTSHGASHSRLENLESQLDRLRQHVVDLEAELAEAHGAKRKMQAQLDEQARKAAEQLAAEKRKLAPLQADVAGGETAKRTQADAREARAHPGPQPTVARAAKVPAKRTIVPATRLPAPTPAPAAASSASAPPPAAPADAPTDLSAKDKMRAVQGLQRELEQQTNELRDLKRTCPPAASASASAAAASAAVQEAHEDTYRILKEEGRRLRARVEELELELGEAREALRAAEEEAAAGREEADRARDEVGRAEAEAGGLRRRVEDAERAAAEAEGREREAEDANGKLRSDLAALEQALEEQRRAAQDLEDRIAGIAAERDGILKLYEQLAEQPEVEARRAVGEEGRSIAAQPALEVPREQGPPEAPGFQDLDGSLAELQGRLEREDEALARLRELASDGAAPEPDALRSELAALQASHREQQGLLERQRATLRDMDAERRRLGEELQERAVQAEQLSALHQQAVQQLVALRQQMGAQPQNAGDPLGQVAQLVAEKQGLSLQLQKAAKDAAAASGDVAALAHENQVLAAQVAGLARDRELMRMDIDAAEAKINQLRETLAIKEDGRNKVMASYGQLAATNDKLQMEVTELAKRNESLRTEISNYQRTLGQLENALASSEQQVADRGLELDRLKRDRNDLVHELESLRDQLNRARGDLAQAASEKALATEQAAAKSKAFEVDKLALESQLSSERTRADRFESLITLERTRKENAERALKDMEASMGNLAKKLQTLNGQHAEMVSALNDEILSLRADQATAATRIESLQSQLVQIQALLDDSRDEVKHKERVIEELLAAPGADSKGRSEVERRILAELASTKEQLRTYEVGGEAERAAAASPDGGGRPQSKISRLSQSSPHAPLENRRGSNQLHEPTPSRSFGGAGITTPRNRASKPPDGMKPSDSAERRHILKQEQMRLQSDLRGL
ncbi:hypothetical protein DFJ74DRAFT_718349 [Hyaloraphidium curvatum]|nr:hypothetical protein DFJ74DRAFT_718349 [Hyaloraphidium curvatum]